MAIHFLLICLCLSFQSFSYADESTPTANTTISTKLNYRLPLFIHPLYFISHICQRQKQYPLEITRKYCSSRLQSNKSQQQQQQRGKRVGWTISV